MVQWIEKLSTESGLSEQLVSEWGVHPLAVEDCLHRNQRPKLDDYESHQFLVWFVVFAKQIFELQFILFKDKIIAVPHDPPPDETSWKQFLKINEDTKDVWHLLYQALDRSTDLSWQEVCLLTSKIDGVEEEMFRSEIKPQILLRYKKRLNQMDFCVGHLGSVTRQLQNLAKPSGDLNWKFRDLYDHCDRIHQTIALYRTQIATTIELFWGLQANRTDEQIKKLTMLASISVPLSVWASFWGMNFQVIPFHRPEMFLIAISIMVASVGLVAWFLVKKGYWSESPRTSRPKKK